MLQTMIERRRESIALYEQGDCADLAAQERTEITVIERFVPRQVNQGEIETAARTVVSQIGAAGIKDMGKVTAALRERHAGVIDFGQASAIVKRFLGCFA